MHKLNAGRSFFFGEVLCMSKGGALHIQKGASRLLCEVRCFLYALDMVLGDRSDANPNYLTTGVNAAMRQIFLGKCGA